MLSVTKTQTILRWLAVPIYLGLLLLMLFQVRATQAQANDEVSFSLYNFGDITLRGPYDTADYFLSVPANWELSNGAKVVVNLDITAFAIAQDGTERRPGGSLEFFFNEIFLDSIPLADTGIQTIELTLPNEALVTTRSDGRHNFKIQLDSGTDCELDTETKVVIYDSSYFVFPHRFVEPALDLSLLPRPFYQRSFEPDLVTVVVPELPTAAELQAAYSIMAGFGNMSSGRLAMNLMTAGELPESLREHKNLIFIGKPGAYPQLNEVKFPNTVDEDGFRAAGARAGDGLVQIAISPWNSAGVVLLITGEDDSAITKASLATSTGQLQVSRRRSITVVADVQPAAFLGEMSATDRTFSQIGYSANELNGVGSDSAFYQFYIPYGKVPEGEAYLDLQYLHTSILDYGQSGLTVFLNGDRVGSAALSEESTKLTTARIALPAASLRPGMNEFQINTLLFPLDNCSGREPNNLWLTIRPESLLHIQLVDANPIMLQVNTLQQFPDPFIYQATLDTTAIIVPQDNVEAWRVAGQLAYYLGDKANTPLANLVVHFADNVPERVRQDRNLLIVGLPSELPILQEINNSLPVPFDLSSDSNSVAENKLPVTYRLPLNANLGYLELLPAPWNPTRSIVAVLGRTNEGLVDAANALITSNLLNQLKGDFATVVDTQIASLMANMVELITTTNEADAIEAEIAASPEPTASTYFTWLEPAMMATTAAMGGVIVLVILINLFKWFRNVWARRRAARQTAKN